jgi:signal transduction histidine kinase
VGRALTAQEEERRRVALELHDETAQSLTALTMALDSMVRKNARLAPEDAATLRETRQIAADVLEGIRRLIYALRPVALQEMGLGAALRWYAEDSMERSGVEVHVATEGAEIEVPDHLELVLYRIGQEALSNVNRHAKASNVWIDIAYRDATVKLAVRDDGVGFEADGLEEPVSRGSGLGMAGMRERAALVDGRLAFESAPGSGTTVAVEVPVAADGG